MKIKIDFECPYPPASCELAEFYIDKALELDERPEYRQWKNVIDKGN